jgi:catechol 2,3-dioxygenase-like lactoylglutathione lyase family enzyme
MFECHHVMLAVSDVAEAREFYIDKLGLPLVEEHPRMFAFRAGALRCSVMPGGRRLPDDTEETAPATLLLSTDDLDAAMQQLTSKGVQFVGGIEVAPGFMRHAPFVDPDNNLLYLCQYDRDPLAAA